MARKGRPRAHPHTADNSTKSTRSKGFAARGEPSPKEQRLEISFTTSATGNNDLPAETGPELAIAGRSNAGKSSFLNRIAGHRQLARVSRTPGRTQLLNFFDVRDGGRLVDLPGYGYAKATRGAQAAWQQSVNSYLSYRDCLVGVILVMDIRHPFQPFDDQLLEWSAASELPLHILLNKADKLKSGARSKALLQAKKRLANVAGVSVQCYSALTGFGQAEALVVIRGLLQHSETQPTAD